MATSSRAPRSISHTQTQTEIPAPGSSPQAVLHLRGARAEAGPSTGRRIQWADDVIDNEGLGRKKSKVCCIYHAPKSIDESSDESSSDDSSDESDGGAGDGDARPARKRPVKKHGHGHGHEHGDDCGHSKGKGRARSPNAYEKMPKAKGAK